MRRFNDIEKELARFEQEIDAMPAASSIKAPTAKSTSAFIPPQLRSRVGGAPPAPSRGHPLPHPSHVRSVPPSGAFSGPVSYQPPFRNPGGMAPVRPAAVIQAKPIKYGDNDGAPAAAPPDDVTAHSDALKRAKAVLDSLKDGGDIPPALNEPLVLSKQPTAAPPSASASSIPLPLNAPAFMQQTSTSTSASVSSAKKPASSKQTGASSSSAATEKEPIFNGVRKAGGEVWTDASLYEWDPTDHRLFCGDLGNETTDDSLGKVFSIYPSFLKAKVIRDKRTSKTRGFGFVSFKDAQDLARAIREMNGKYVGNRPIKLRKSTWKDRNIEVVKKKEKSRKRLGLPF